MSFDYSIDLWFVYFYHMIETIYHKMSLIENLTASSLANANQSSPQDVEERRSRQPSPFDR